MNATANHRPAPQARRESGKTLNQLSRRTLVQQLGAMGTTTLVLSSGSAVKPGHSMDRVAWMRCPLSNLPPCTPTCSKSGCGRPRSTTCSSAAGWAGRGIDLGAEFGPLRVRFCAIDEQWIVGGVLGMAMIGVPAIAHLPSMTTFIPFELMFNHAGKLRYMTGGQAAFPMVLRADMQGRAPLQTS